MNARDGDAGAARRAAESPVPVAGLGWSPADCLRRLLVQFDRMEMRIVGAQRRLGARRPLCAVSDTANWLGNGWLYLLLGGLLLFVGTRPAYLALLQAGLGVAAAHAVYPWIKRRIARLRPFERMPQWQPDIPVLDRYSFPSGHCMTATAVAVPLAQAFPNLLWGIVGGTAVIAWARMACAHHYPSDLVAGCALGAATAHASAELLAWLQVL